MRFSVRWDSIPGRSNAPAVVDAKRLSDGSIQFAAFGKPFLVITDFVGLACAVLHTKAQRKYADEWVDKKCADALFEIQGSKDAPSFDEVEVTYTDGVNIGGFFCLPGGEPGWARGIIKLGRGK